MVNIENVVVVGCGPASLSTCRILSKFGIKTILVGRQYIPEKPCGGGLTRRCVKILNLVFPEYLEVIKSRIDTVYIIHRRCVYKIESREIMYTTTRREFDSKFLKAVVDYEGVEYIPENVVKIYKRDRVYRIVTDRDTVIESKIVIAGDGVYSKVRQCLENYNIRKLPYAVRTYCKGWNFQDTVILDFSKNLDYGYFWIFPIGSNIVNIGFGTFKGNLKDIDKKLRKYIDSINLKIISDLRGHALPKDIKNITSIDKKVIYIGDAAGLIDYTLGEGITYATISGILAAISYIKNMKNPGELYEKYMKNIIIDLKIARKNAIHIPYIVDRILDLTIKNIITRGKLSIEILNGKETYYKAIRKLLNMREVLKHLLKS